VEWYEIANDYGITKDFFIVKTHILEPALLNDTKQVYIFSNPL
jgi:hypothetical protein